MERQEFADGVASKARYQLKWYRFRGSTIVLAKSVIPNLRVEPVGIRVDGFRLFR